MRSDMSQEGDVIIWKYPIMLGTTIVEMPFGSKILSVQVQNDIPNIWILAESWEAERKYRYEPRRFEVLPTGLSFNNKTGMLYVGTFQLDNGNFVGHLFEIK